MKTANRPSTARREGASKCRRKFLRYFPNGFHDAKYLAWERDYKWKAHEAWESTLGKRMFRDLIDDGKFIEVARRAIGIESRTNLLFSFEKMAVRDAVRAPSGARAFAEGLFDLLHGAGSHTSRFERWCTVVGRLPRRQTRVLTWPVVTVFGFLAQPSAHIYFKPIVSRRAAIEYGHDLAYESRPSAEAYNRFLDFADLVRRDVVDLEPRDMIDLQSFIWVQGSDEYPG